jgi:hypothetical protein
VTLPELVLLLLVVEVVLELVAPLVVLLLVPALVLLPLGIPPAPPLPVVVPGLPPVPALPAVSPSAEDSTLPEHEIGTSTARSSARTGVLFMRGVRCGGGAVHSGPHRRRLAYHARR